MQYGCRFKASGRAEDLSLHKQHVHPAIYCEGLHGHKAGWHSVSVSMRVVYLGCRGPQKAREHLHWRCWRLLRALHSEETICLCWQDYLSCPPGVLRRHASSHVRVGEQISAANVELCRTCDM